MSGTSLPTLSGLVVVVEVVVVVDVVLVVEVRCCILYWPLMNFITTLRT